jgi:hypothetical protein
MVSRPRRYTRNGKVWSIAEQDLPKGVYVFEYAVRVQHKGKYPTGFANIECMYAPEFNSHSKNINLEVK